MKRAHASTRLRRRTLRARLSQKKTILNGGAKDVRQAGRLRVKERELRRLRELRCHAGALGEDDNILDDEQHRERFADAHPPGT